MLAKTTENMQVWFGNLNFDIFWLISWCVFFKTNFVLKPWALACPFEYHEPYNQKKVFSWHKVVCGIFSGIFIITMIAIFWNTFSNTNVHISIKILISNLSIKSKEYRKSKRYHNMACLVLKVIPSFVFLLQTTEILAWG